MSPARRMQPRHRGDKGRPKVCENCDNGKKIIFSMKKTKEIGVQTLSST